MSDAAPDSPVERELQKAKQALTDAANAYDAGISEATIINRLYYAAFHAIQAVLYDHDYNPTSHGGVRSLFGSEIIAAGEATREDGRFFSKLSELRHQADYGYEELDEDIDTLLVRTRRLVTELEALCAPEDSSSPD